MFNLDDYETVAQRVMRLKSIYPESRVLTEVISLDHVKGEILAKAFVYVNSDLEAKPAASDYAFGIAATYPMSMRKFYVEDTITSAIGRAISLVIPTDKKPTREDMEKVEKQVTTDKLIKETKEKMKESSGEYVPVPNPNDPWTVVPTKQGQTLGEAVEVLEQTGFAAPMLPTMQQCKCKKDMVWRQGQKKNGSLWGQFVCTNVPQRKCQDPIWFDLKNGQWVAQ